MTCLVFFGLALAMGLPLTVLVAATWLPTPTHERTIDRPGTEHRGRAR
ncbi:hypothetical protein ACIGO9_19325 [Nocardia asteroides]